MYEILISMFNTYRILYGHVVGMMWCDWPFTVWYIINSY